MSELEGKDISELIANGMGKLASMPSGEALFNTVCYLVHRYFSELFA